MSKKIECTNENIIESIKKREVMVKEIKDIVAQAEVLDKQGKELQTQYDALQQSMAREDEKVKPELKEEATKIEMAEFEEVSRVYLEEDKVFIEVANRLDEFKAFYKQKKDEQTKKDNSSNYPPTNGDTEDSTGLPPEHTEESGDLLKK